MTEPTDRAAQLARVEKLRARRTSAEPVADTPSKAPLPRRRRRHPALGGRIAAAGLGATTMFGLVTLLGLDNPSTQATGGAATSPAAPAPVAAPAPPIKIVIHRPTTPAPAPTTVAAQAPDTPADTPAATTGPIELTANPVVRTVTVQGPSASRQSAPAARQAAPAPQPAPAATTSGSR